MAGENHQAGGRRVREIAGRRIVFDGEAFFEEPDDWSPEAAEALAREAGLDELTDDHWRVMRFLRDYYYQYGRAPLNKKLKAGLDMSLSEVEDLFPGGIKHGARRLAGLPNPKSCM
jgi:tRNA 2-thiouridine synthesizing protein E